jgi:hypothetical protein
MIAPTEVHGRKPESAGGHEESFIDSRRFSLEQTLE